jgi:cobalt/nickel transport system ATP-binding protein
MEDIIILQDVSYAYFGQITALKKISISVKAGELFGIIGQNGSGKTTLLHIINALILPDSGEVLFKGSPLTKKSMEDFHFNRMFRQSVGYIFQNPDIQLFCPTVYDELLFGPLQTDIPLAEVHDRACKILDALGINDLKNRPVCRLSGGEKKKVAIASVLTMNPDVLLIDEPLARLDPKTQTFFIELLIELNQAGKTIIFTTHHLDLIDHLQPRVAILSDDHTIQRTGSAAEILTDEEFLVSVNLIHEHVHRHGDETHRHFHSHYVFHRH